MMKQTVIEQDDDGAIVSYEGTPEERAERLARWLEDPANLVLITSAQEVLLARLRQTD